MRFSKEEAELYLKSSFLEDKGESELSNPGGGEPDEVTECKCRGGSAQPGESAGRGGAAKPQITS